MASSSLNPKEKIQSERRFSGKIIKTDKYLKSRKSFLELTKNDKDKKILEEQLKTRLEKRAKELLKSNSPEINKLIDETSFDIPISAENADKKLKELVFEKLEETINKIADTDKKKALEETKAILQKQLEKTETETIKQILRLDKSIHTLPEFRDSIEGQKIANVTKLAGISDAIKNESIISKTGRLGFLTDGKIDKLVDEKDINKTEAKKLKKVCRVYNILEENYELSELIISENKGLKEFAKWDKSVWQKKLKDKNIKNKYSFSKDEYAEALVKKFKKLFPYSYLHKRIIDNAESTGIDDARKAQFKELMILNKDKKSFINKDFTRLAVSGINADKIKELKTGFDSIIKLSNKYTGLPIIKILEDESIDKDKRLEEVLRKIKVADDFFSMNADVLEMDFSPLRENKEIENLKYSSEIQSEDKPQLYAMVRSVQRSFAISNNADNVEKLVEAGYSSAYSVTKAPISKVAKDTGITTDELNVIKAKAKKIAGRTAAKTSALLDVAVNDLSETRAGNIQTSSIMSYLKDIPGYESFFGSQDFCNCQHCQSILSPAAYFVDLMDFIESNVTEPFFSDKPNHALKLSNRRPDLWYRLELTCENTNTELPYLQIINEVLEDAVIDEIDSTVSLTDRTTIEQKIYGERLPSAVNSFTQPLNLAFEEVKLFIEHFEKDLGDLAEIALAKDNDLARLNLALSPEQFSIITIANTNFDDLNNIYGYTFETDSGTLKKVQPKLILNNMGINRTELGEFISTLSLKRNNDVSEVFIKAEKLDATVSVQNDVEYIYNLTEKTLDFLHRFVRLWKSTKWKIGELDLLLIALADEGYGSININDKILQALGTIKRFQNILQTIGIEISIEELIALFSLIPNHPVIQKLPGADNPYDQPFKFPANSTIAVNQTIPFLRRIFTDDAFVNNALNSPVDFLHHKFSATGSIDLNLNILLRGLGVDEDQLFQLITGLVVPLGINPESVSESDKKFSLSHFNISLLYRHASIARMLKITISELFALISLNSDIVGYSLEYIEDVISTYKLRIWQKTTKWNIKELVDICCPGHAPHAVSRIPITGTSAGDKLSYITTVYDTVQPEVNITFSGNTNIEGVIQEINSLAASLFAFRSDLNANKLSSGSYITLVTKQGHGNGTKIKITQDSAQLFTSTVPRDVNGTEFTLLKLENESQIELADELVSKISEDNLLVFSDTVFTQLNASSGTAVSRNPITSTNIGDRISYNTIVNGMVGSVETINFTNQIDLAGVINEWNSIATETEAFRSDDKGTESESGTFLSVRLRNQTGAFSKFRILEDSASIFGIPPTAAVKSNIEFTNTQTGDEVSLIIIDPSGIEFEESISFSSNNTISEIIDDWNNQSNQTTVTRVDASGHESASGNYLRVKPINSSSVISINRDPQNIFIAMFPKDYYGIEITEDLSREILSLNSGYFNSIDADGHYMLNETYNPSVTIVLPESLQQLESNFKNLLDAFLSGSVLQTLLPARIGVEPNVLSSYLLLIDSDLNDILFYNEVRGNSTPVNIAELLSGLLKLNKVFNNKQVFTNENLNYIYSHKDLFEIDSFNSLRILSLKSINLYKEISQGALDNDIQPSLLNEVLLGFNNAISQPFSNVENQLAQLFHVDKSLISSVENHLILSSKAMPALLEIIDAIAFVQYLGLGVSNLQRIQSTTYSEIQNVSLALQATIKTKYPDEQEWTKVMKPFEDRILSKKRDGLVAYMLHSLSVKVFTDANDLYHYFLLDVKVEGSVRTSRVAAGIDSLQLYVHRCRNNQEESKPNATDHIHVLPDSIPDAEWEWKQNYRVWEANRKVFLNPENFIEPEMRDNKTELFKKLEEELLSNKINTQSVLEAYSRYLRDFDALSRLKIAGTYHEKDNRNQRDVLHLFGATEDEPPTYYYRRVDNFHYGHHNDDIATNWNSWIKIDIQVPVRKVSPIVFNGQLYVFWVRYTTKSENKLIGGDSKFVGYQHNAKVEFSKRNFDNSWSQPQPISLMETPFTDIGDGVILDPLVYRNSYTIDIPFLPSEYDPIIYTDRQPLYDNKYHAKAKDDYTLKGFRWDRIYPTTGSAITLRGMDFKMWSKLDLFRRKIGPQLNYSDTLSALGYGDELINCPVPWIQPGVLEFFVCLIWIFVGREAASELYNSLLKKFLWSYKDGDNRYLHLVKEDVLPLMEAYTMASLLLEKENVDFYKEKMGVNGVFNRSWWPSEVTEEFDKLFNYDWILTSPVDAHYDIVNGSDNDVVIQTARDVFHIGFNEIEGKPFLLRRFNTSITERMNEILFTKGINNLLSTESQFIINELGTDIGIDSDRVFDGTYRGQMDYNGPMGVYFREIYFHIPFLLADHLNTQGQFEEAEQWYRFIFDPTSAEIITDIDTTLPAADQERRKLDRSWRFREFRNLDFETLREMLTNNASIEEYRNNPFNPHAIARLRPSAYQKAIVMKYIDNLIDWGDYLYVLAYNTLNQEYLREATLKYIIAEDLMGTNPVNIGDCGQGMLSSKTYPAIKEALIENGEFLLEMETIVSTTIRRISGEAEIVFNDDKDLYDVIYDDLESVKKVFSRVQGRQIKESDIKMLIDASENDLEKLAKQIKISVSDFKGFVRLLFEESMRIAMCNPTDEFIGKAFIKWLLTATDKEIAILAKKYNIDADDLIMFKKQLLRKIKSNRSYKENPCSNNTFNPKPEVDDKDEMSGFTVDTVTQISPVFCVPKNVKLQSYRNLVQNRLFNIRNSLDINGVFRQLPLFAPPIDPALLVGARAAGLGMEDILTNSAGNVPPYRFRYLIEKAKSYASSLQGFGNELYAALEKRDAEELVQIQNIHQKNILKLNKELIKNELETTEQNVKSAQQRKSNAQYRYEYYDQLISEGLTPAEHTKTGAVITSVVATATQIGLATGAGVAHLVPQVGSPFAMKFGGKEIGDSLKAWSTVASIVGKAAEMTSTIAGMVADYERREQGWEHQKKLAEDEIKVLDYEIKVAELRRNVAKQNLKIHDNNVEQHEEIISYQKEKFTNLGLYTHLARTLKQLNREVYNNAYAIARLAEQAYHFERTSDKTIYMGGEWDSSRSGLLAGNKLLHNLQRMERRYIETYKRTDEIKQHFSIFQIQPEALLELKETGKCEFSIPEFNYDLIYPGQYRRRIRSVQISIPCITGPYVNIGAKLTLLKSYIRYEAVAGQSNLIELPPDKDISISTSSAQNDAGVFELSFNGENYMPFEGSGAISKWRLNLPSNLRSFNYDTISDVVLTINYVAEDSDALRAIIESDVAATMGSLSNYLTQKSLQRVYSIRKEFSKEFHAVLSSPVNTPVKLTFNNTHFPVIFNDKTIKIRKAYLVLVLSDNYSLNMIDIGFDTAANASSLPVFNSNDCLFAGLPYREIPSSSYNAGQIIGEHTITVYNAGTLGLDPTDTNNSFTIDKNKLRDVYIIFEYGL